MTGPHSANRPLERRTPDESLALWHRYRATKDEQLRNRLVLTYVPLVKHIVYRKLRELPASCEVDDLLSAGIVALIAALDRYEPEKGASLEPFLWTRIYGATLDELRRRDWAPRSVRRLERRINEAREEFAGVHGRLPADTELADMLSLSISDLKAHQGDIARSEVTSLNSLVVGESDDEGESEVVNTLESEDQTADPEHATAKAEAKERFREAFAALPDRDREVAVLLYVKNLKLHEIAEILGVSESRVSQIHSGLKKKIREQLKDDAHLFSEVA